MSVRKLTTTVQVNNCEEHPLMVNADFNCEFDAHEGWNWEVERINHVELQVGSKEGVDLTRQIKANPRAFAILEASVANCNEQIYEALSGKEEREHERA